MALFISTVSSCNVHENCYNPPTLYKCYESCPTFVASATDFDVSLMLATLVVDATEGVVGWAAVGAYSLAGQREGWRQKQWYASGLAGLPAAPLASPASQHARYPPLLCPF